jgi:hypothetical protein
LVWPSASISMAALFMRKVSDWGRYFIMYVVDELESLLIDLALRVIEENSI